VSEPGLHVEVVDGDEAARSRAVLDDPVIATGADGCIVGGLDVELPTVGKRLDQRAWLEVRRGSVQATFQT
jgi:hypothetical protein